MLNGPWTVRNVKGGVFGLIHHPVYCVGPHEVYQHCDAHCDQMCDGSNKMGLSCDYRICLAGCNCKPGYARNDQDKCIRITECKRPPIKEKSRKKKKLHKKPKPNRVERLA
ncbi:uncharacterized protein LOC113386600 [Ctenocephalides felis]|nr:uncharacterized protein LOC113386600 [Ctenocephalides felis]